MHQSDSFKSLLPGSQKVRNYKVRSREFLLPWDESYLCFWRTWEKWRTPEGDILWWRKKKRKSSKAMESRWRSASTLKSQSLLHRSQNVSFLINSKQSNRKQNPQTLLVLLLSAIIYESLAPHWALSAATLAIPTAAPREKCNGALGCCHSNIINHTLNKPEVHWTDDAVRDKAQFPAEYSCWERKSVPSHRSLR